MYLSSLQVGLQSAHCLSDMFVKYEKRKITHVGNEEIPMLHNWAEEHKTMILLNGGYSETLRNLLNFFDDKRNPYPFAYFNEGQDALDGALTCVGIILPEKIYESSAYIRSLPFRKKEEVIKKIKESGTIELEPYQGIAVTHELSKWEFELVLELNNYGLAS
jgi:hypothetical protein